MRSYSSDEKAPFLFALIFFLMGLFVCVIVPVSFIPEFKSLDYPTMNAIVVDNDVVMFEEDGKQYFLYVSTEGYYYGNKVKVKYNPDDINDAYIGGNTYGGLVAGLIISMFMGGIFMVIGLCLMFPNLPAKIFKKKSKKESAFGEIEY